MNQDTVKHLEFIQNVITRMNTNSFQIKNWSVTIAAALIALYASSKIITFVILAAFPVLIFWFLDAYYLCQERKFRGIYNDVAGLTEEPKYKVLFAMRPDLYIGGKYKYLSSFFSTTVLLLYLPMSGIIIGVYIYLKLG